MASQNIDCDDLRACFISPNEQDSNFEPANIVDAMFAIARSIHKLGLADACTPMGALEAVSKEVHDGFEKLSNSIDGLANAIDRSELNKDA